MHCFYSGHWMLYRRHIKIVEQLHERSHRSIMGLVWQERVTVTELGPGESWYSKHWSNAAEVLAALGWSSSSKTDPVQGTEQREAGTMADLQSATKAA